MSAAGSSLPTVNWCIISRALLITCSEALAPPAAPAHAVGKHHHQTLVVIGVAQNLYPVLLVFAVTFVGSSGNIEAIAGHIVLNK